MTIRRVPIVLLALLTACGGARRGPEGTAPATVGTLVLPAGFEPRYRYPLVVMLPASNGTADAMRRSYPDVGNVIVLVASGTGTPADYATNEEWARTISRYESQLLSDLGALAAWGYTDPERVVLAGFSMGGDLAWALALRNPALVHGAIVMGSRMSYRSGAADHAALADGRHRFYLVMGADEDRTRMAGAQTGRRFLETLGVRHYWREVPDLAHLRAPADVFADALAYVLAGDP